MRLMGTDLKDHKSIELSLTAIYGIGRSLAKKICRFCKVEASTKVINLSAPAAEKLRSEVNNLLLEGDLRRFILSNIRRLKIINCYRGMRHRKGLPTRGQRTRTNSRTVRRTKLQA